MTMPSLRARFVNLFLPPLGIKARFASAQALSMALTDDPPVRVRPACSTCAVALMCMS